MIFKIQNLCIALIILFLASCQNDYDDIYEGGDTVKMNFSFSPELQITSGTEHVPMNGNARASAGDITITNWYRILIAKKIESKWIVDQIVDKKFDNTDIYNLNNYYVSDVLPLMNFSVVLRPGEYKMTIFTGARSVTWNGSLKTGAIIQDEAAADSDPIYACTYRKVENGYLNVGTDCLDEEIFTGTTSFVVKKTQDLHSESLVEDNHIPLYRKVTKLRIMLKDEVKNPGDESFATGFLGNGISALVKIADDKEFCYGLNVWGEPCYEEGVSLKEMTYGAFSWIDYTIGSDGGRYLFGMRNGSRQLSIYYFVEEGISIPVTISNIIVTVNPQVPKFVYIKETTPIILKYNHITAVAFKPNGDSWLGQDEYGNWNTYLGMDVVSESTTEEIPTDLTDVFSYNYEYTPRN